MGKRGPKPTREKTTHIRVPVSLAQVLRKAADQNHVTIAVLLDRYKDKILGLLPMPPSEGHPLPRRMGVRWPVKAKKGD